MTSNTATYQTRLQMDQGIDCVFHACSCLLNRVEHALYAEVSKGNTTASCKNSFLRRFDITARQFNACRVSLEGKIAASRAGQERAIISLQQQIEILDKQIRTLEKKPSRFFAIHQKKRRRESLSHRLNIFEEDKKQKRSRLCFGSKKLFRAQYNLEKNGFSSYQEWKQEWQARRSSEFFVLGSKDETAGNQSCVATLQDNGKLQLRLRLPHIFEKTHGKYLYVKDVYFAYGHAALVSALKRPQAISYRFKKDRKGWRVFVSLDIPKAPIISSESQGVIGIDLNSDHIAYVETDRFGNPIDKKIFPWISYGKTKHQLRAITGDICKEIVNKAKEVKKPIVIEELNFQKKKLTLHEESPAFARLLSSFAYGLFSDFLTARASKEGIAIHQVTPAFTSVIGRCNYAKRYGLSIHMAAALCIARRYQKFSETPCSPTSNIPDGKGGHVAFVLPVRNRTKHVWHFWGRVKKKLKTVLAAHYKAMKNRSLNPQSIHETGIPCSCW